MCVAGPIMPRTVAAADTQPREEARCSRMWGLESVVLYYVNQKGSKTGEYMEIGPTGKVSKVVANYSG